MTPATQRRTDEEWMRAALHIAARGNGRVAPNPAVGCIIVKNDIVVGRGWTQPGGCPHAETVALEQAGKDAAGATAYVTLEPCAHFGKTAPCADALVQADIKRVVVALRDPDARVNGKGIERLQDAGIEVVEHILNDNAARHHRGFIYRTSLKRPQLTLKLATSSDFKIAKANGDSKWITGPKARQYGHMLRATHDAILVGVNTVLADDPMLTCRIQSLEGQSPVRIVLDTHLKTPLTSKLVVTASEVPTVLITEQRNAEPFEKKGVKTICVASTRDMGEICQALAEEGLNTVLIEGGSQVATSFAQAGYIDTCAHFRAPDSIGADGIDALAGISLHDFLKSDTYILEKTRKLDADILELYHKAG